MGAKSKRVRRRFLELESSFATEAKQVLDVIDELFRIESLCLTGPPGNEVRAQLRAEKLRPLVKQIEQWALSVQAFPESGLRKAIEYMGNMWSPPVRPGRRRHPAAGRSCGVMVGLPDEAEIVLPA